MTQKKPSKIYTAPALEKGLDILELLSSSEEGLTQAEIASKLNKSVNEIYRMISTLKQREYVDFDEEEESGSGSEESGEGDSESSGNID